MRPNLRLPLWTWLAIALTLLALAACSGRKPNGSSNGTPGATPLALPDKSAADLIKPDDGGVITLRQGAQLALPRQALSAPTMVTLRALEDTPEAPIPLSLIGRAYDLAFDGGSLIGVATLTLPLPAGATEEQYELAPYHWTGRAWERVDGRIAGGAVNLGLDLPGTYALLGSWRLADATLAVDLPPVTAGQPALPVEVRGQYRYRALPALQHDYVEAHLALKRDNSGGAGQVEGNQALDPTVADTVVWFKPDPTQAEGAIDFNYTFKVDPAALNVPLGSVNQFYATLAVADSAAPTRRLSSAVQYVAQLPIRVEGTDVIRPEVANSGQTLQWHVWLNGQSLFQRPAAGLTLSLADILAQGGLGEYKIALEAEYQGQYVAVSNEVTVQLALPGTVTPTSRAVALATPWPFGTMPATPTRRTPPNGVPGSLDYTTPGASNITVDTATPTSTPTPAVTATPTRPTGDVFWADSEVLAAGGCTTLHWNVENITAVYLDGAGTTGNSSRQVCPQSGTTYTLNTIDASGKSRYYRVTITVQGTAASGGIAFTVDHYQIRQGDCATLSWRAVNVSKVYLNDKGVAGEATESVCPQYTTDYKLAVTDTSGNTTTQLLTIWVAGADQILIQFWADQYALPAGACTTLHWIVDNIDSVYLRSPNGSESGVAGHDVRENVCPGSTATYAIRATASGDRAAVKELTLQVGGIGLGARELIAQGVVSSITQVADLDPNTSGKLAGWRIVVDGVSPLVKGTDSCCQSRMTLSILQGMVAGQYPLQVDWPLHTGQLIEFWLSPCSNTECPVYSIPARFYLKARSN